MILDPNYRHNFGNQEIEQPNINPQKAVIIAKEQPLKVKRKGVKNNSLPIDKATPQKGKVFQTIERDLSKLIPVEVNNNTTYYVKTETDSEKIRARYQNKK